MSEGINLSEKYGLNPTIPICFWCGEEKNEIRLMGKVQNKHGEEIEMPSSVCMDYEPCEKCREIMESGFTVIEATKEPNWSAHVPMEGIYPTGRFVVVSKDAARRAFEFDDPKDYDAGKVGMLPEDFGRLLADIDRAEEKH